MYVCHAVRVFTVVLQMGASEHLIREAGRVSEQPQPLSTEHM